jgi:hypothetical protein
MTDFRDWVEKKCNVHRNPMAIVCTAASLPTNISPSGRYGPRSPRPTKARRRMSFASGDASRNGPLCRLAARSFSSGVRRMALIGPRASERFARHRAARFGYRLHRSRRRKGHDNAGGFMLIGRPGLSPVRLRRHRQDNARQAPRRACRRPRHLRRLHREGRACHALERLRRRRHPTQPDLHLPRNRARRSSSLPTSLRLPRPSC